MSNWLKSSTGAGHAIGQREFVVLMAALMSMGALAIDAMLPALDAIAYDLKAGDPNNRQLVVGGYLLAGGLGCLVPGVFADRYGRRPVLFVSLGFYIVGSLLCAIVQDFATLIVLRTLQGLGSAGLSVLPAAVIRDRFQGDLMARLMSLIFIVFMVVPVLAPSLGQAVLLFADWRWIFVVIALLGAAIGLWAWLRMPETLKPAARQNVDMRTVSRNLLLTLRTRTAVGYVFASALTFGSMFGYINSSQQLIAEHFGAAKEFPLIFGATASTLALSSFINSRIVERFGARRVSHTALLMFMVVSALQIYAAHNHGTSLAWFIPLMSINLCMLGFIGTNFSSIAMQPFENTAGSASSAQAFIRLALGAVIGIAIGQAYDESARPLAYSLFICSLIGLGLVLFSERGKLFRRPRQARKYLATHDAI